MGNAANYNDVMFWFWITECAMLGLLCIGIRRAFGGRHNLQLGSDHDD